MADTVKMRPREYIKIRGANEHNLKSLDGRIFHELVRGQKGRQAFLHEILEVLSLAGGREPDA